MTHEQVRDGPLNIWGGVGKIEKKNSSKHPAKKKKINQATSQEKKTTKHPAKKKKINQAPSKEKKSSASYKGKKIKQRIPEREKKISNWPCREDINTSNIWNIYIYLY